MLCKILIVSEVKIGQSDAPSFMWDSNKPVAPIIIRVLELFWQVPG